MARQSRAIPYLVEREGRYWARVVIPADVREAIGKRELRQPLGADRKQALQTLSGYVASFLDTIAAARRKESTTIPARVTRPLSLAGIANMHYAESLAFDEECRAADYRYAAHGFVDEDQVRALRSVVSGAASNPEIERAVGRFIRKFAARGNTTVEPGTPEWRGMARVLASVELEALSRQVERDEGDFTGQPELPILRERPAELDAPPPVPLLKLLDAYLVERAKIGRGAEARRRWTPVFTQFIAYLGHDDAERVTAEKAEAWLSDVLDRKAPKTVRDTDLAALRAVYRWATRRKRVTHNPFAEITLDAPRKVRSREKGFTDDEAIAVLKAARGYQPEASSNPRNRESAPTTAAKRWAPWLCAFTGARISEMTQLRKEDVRERDGFHVIRITPEAGSVKTGEFRDVPLHPQLVELGFLRFVAEAAPGPLFYDGAIRRKAGAEHPSKKSGDRVSDWIRKLGIIGNVPPTHAWRHRMKTIGRELGVDPRVMDAIHGHASGRAADDYGDVTLKAKAAVISRMPAFAVT